MGNIVREEEALGRYHQFTCLVGGRIMYVDTLMHRFLSGFRHMGNNVSVH